MFRKPAVVLLAAIVAYTVVWAGKGIGIPGVDVVLKKKPPDMIIGTARTDATGHYTFTNVAPGACSMVIDEAGVKLEGTSGGSNARSIAPAPIPATLARSAGGGTDVTFAGQRYELSVAGRGVTVSEGKIKQTPSGVTIEINLNVVGGGTTITGVVAKAAKPSNPNGSGPDKQNN